MTFCDVAMLYNCTGGGIRTFYNAKIEWFARQCRHQYVLVVSGPRQRVQQLASSVTLVESRGIPLGRGHESYRLFVNFRHVVSALKGCRPTIVEAGDPWVSGPLALAIRRSKYAPRIVSSFFHSDPVRTYLERCLQGLVPVGLTQGAIRQAAQAFFRLQAAYDLTVVASRSLVDRLKQAGVTRVACAPFGVDAEIFDAAERRSGVN